MIEPIEKQNVADTVYYKMLNMIIEGEWKQGAMIPSENELRRLFLSADTVRQAVHRLSALGILRSRQRQGHLCGKNRYQLLHEPIGSRCVSQQG